MDPSNSDTNNNSDTHNNESPLICQKPSDMMREMIDFIKESQKEFAETVQQKDRAIMILSQELNKAKAENAALSNSQNDIASFKDQLSQANERVAELEGFIKEKEAEIDDLKAELDKLKADLDETCSPVSKGEDDAESTVGTSPEPTSPSQMTDTPNSSNRKRKGQSKAKKRYNRAVRGIIRRFSRKRQFESLDQEGEA